MKKFVEGKTFTLDVKEGYLNVKEIRMSTGGKNIYKVSLAIKDFDILGIFPEDEKPTTTKKTTTKKAGK